MENNNNNNNNSFLEYTLHVKSAIQESIENILSNTNILKPYRRVYLSDKCNICKSEFKDNNQISIVLPCGHLFHENCILQWGKDKKMFDTPCPLCRVSFLVKCDKI